MLTPRYRTLKDQAPKKNQPPPGLLGFFASVASVASVRLHLVVAIPKKILILFFDFPDVAERLLVSHWQMGEMG